MRCNAQGIYRLIKQERLIESSALVDSKERGEREAKREDIVEVLAARLGMMPGEIRLALGGLREMLTRLMRARCDSLKAFQQALQASQEEP